MHLVSYDICELRKTKERKDNRKGKEWK